jgi:phospholipase/carboxylesterase
VNGFAWWPLPIGADGMPIRQPEPAQFVGSGPHTAALALLEWLDQLSSRVQDRSGAGLGTVALLGFSQGGCMVTSLLRLQPERFVCGVNCSGFVAPGAFDGDARLAQLRPPMFWGRDELDPIIDESRIATTGCTTAFCTASAPRSSPISQHSCSGTCPRARSTESPDERTQTGHP